MRPVSSELVRSRRHNSRGTSIQRLEDRIVLSSVSFVAHDVIRSDASSATDVVAADLDTDGDLDILFVARDDKIGWFENTDGAGTFGQLRVISTVADDPWSVIAADLDGDGDADVLSVSSGARVAWFENVDGRGAFGPMRTISSSATGARSVVAADFDGDDDLDVLIASDTVAWFENTDGRGFFGEQQVITAQSDFAQSVFAADLDGDGDVDAIAAENNLVAWYENNGQGVFGERQTITTEAASGESVVAADIDGDGDLDVLSGSARDGELAWYENTDGDGAFGLQRIVDPLAIGNESVRAADIDGDGDLDVLSGARHGIAWYENTDGQGAFGDRRMVTTRTNWTESVAAADLDGDGDVDALSASKYDDKVAWYENTDGQGRFGDQRVLTHAAAGSRSAVTADIDGDGDQDVISASVSDDKVAWYENTDGHGKFGRQRVISRDADGASSVYVADVDGDGDADVLSASSLDGKVAWYENLDGRGTFSDERIISLGAARVDSVFAADLDGDGDLDVLSTSSRRKNILAWYENEDGAGTFGSARTIGQNDESRSIDVADVDGDGDLDVLEAFDSGVAWYENEDGAGSFGSRRLITSEVDHANSVRTSDLDGDGDLDVLSASVRDNKVAWYENTDGRGTFGAQRVLTKLDRWDLILQVSSTDIDGDGDADVVSNIDNRLVWFENTDGRGTFSPLRVVLSGPDGTHARSLSIADIDGDGDNDVLSAFSNIDLEFSNELIAWYENRPYQGPDCDEDGEITIIDANCVPEELLDDFLADLEPASIRGDLDGDGVVGFADFLTLSSNFQERGQYTSGDLNKDGTINFDDFLILSGSFGKSGASREAEAAAVDVAFKAMRIPAIAGHDPA